ncbi:MAG TPA: hypothetical protein DC063_04800 [Arenimonas sp.]|nr:hypothetical protein [Arenimonas sp.]
MPSQNQTEAPKYTNFIEWRRANRPELRREHPVGITHNGSVRRVYGCVCGATVSMCNRWPVTKAVNDFWALHDATCDPSKPVYRRYQDARARASETGAVEDWDAVGRLQRQLDATH